MIYTSYSAPYAYLQFLRGAHLAAPPAPKLPDAR